MRLRFIVPSVRGRRPAASLAAVSAAWLLFAASPGAALAQEDTEGSSWQATAELTFTGASGNQSLSLITTGFRLRHRNPRRFAGDLRVQGRYGSSTRDGERERVAESYRGILNLDVGPGNRWTPFLHLTADHDPFRRLDARVNSGAGAKLNIERSDGRGEASLRMALLHSYESIRTDTGSVSGSSARWSMQLAGEQELRDGLTLAHTAQYQPVYDGLADYLLNVETSIRVMVTRRVAVSLSHEYDRDSTPPEGVHRDDRLLKAGLMIRL